MTYSIFGPTPLFATEVLLESLVVVVVVLVVPPTIIAGGLWAGYMKEIDIFDDDDFNHSHSYLLHFKKSTLYSHPNSIRLVEENSTSYTYLLINL